MVGSECSTERPDVSWASFVVEPWTTFEIEDGLIVRSTDDYDLSDAPWG
jgi:hypothetical protein